MGISTSTPRHRPYNGTATTLYAVNTTTGVATAVGSGLNSGDPLALVYNGDTLYGIDTFARTQPQHLYH